MFPFELVNLRGSLAVSNLLDCFKSGGVEQFVPQLNGHLPSVDAKSTCSCCHLPVRSFSCLTMSVVDRDFDCRARLLIYPIFSRCQLFAHLSAVVHLFTTSTDAFWLTSLKSERQSITNLSKSDVTWMKSLLHHLFRLLKGVWSAKR